MAKTAKRITLYVLAAGQKTLLRTKSGKPVKPGGYVPKAYALRYKNKVTKVYSYRSLATGHNIKKEHIRESLPEQRLEENVRTYNTKRGIKSEKVVKHVVDLVTRIKEAPVNIIGHMAKADENYERIFQWMIEHEEELEIDEEHLEALREVVDTEEEEPDE